MAAATLAAFFERWWFPSAWREATSPTSIFYYGDATRFIEYARAIVAGRLYDNGIPFHPPGWPLLLAAVFRWSGVATGASIPIGAIKVLTALFSSVSVGLAALLAGEVAGLGALVAVTLLAPFDFGHIVEGTVANSEALYGLLVVVGALASRRWFRADRAGASAWAVTAGVAAGAAMLVRAEYLAAVVVTVAFAWIRLHQRRSVAIYVAAIGLFLTPTTIWHWRTLSAFNAAHAGRIAGPLPRFAPVTSYGPFNFAMANHEDADGGPNRDHPMLDSCDAVISTDLAAGQLNLACPAIYELYVHGYAIGAGWLLNNPSAALTLASRKIALTIGFLADGFFADNIGVGVTGVRRRVDLLDPANRWLLPVRLLLVVVGVWTLRRSPVAFVVVAAPLAALVGSTLLIYGYVRLGVAYLPIVYVLIGAGIARIARRLSGRVPITRMVAVSLIAIALGLAYERTVRDVDRPLVVQGTRSPNGRLLEDEVVEISRP